MGPFSHYALARQLADFVRPEQADAYLWGALAPDVRYLAGMRRDQTHLGQAQLADLAARYPAWASFLQGYRVHCLLDEVDAAALLNRSFPVGALLRALGKPISAQQAVVLVELHFLRGAPGGTFSGGHNPALGALGVPPEHSAAFAAALAGYVARPSPDTALEAFQRAGMISDGRIERYRRAYQAIRGRPALQALMGGAVRSAHIEQRALAHVQRRWQEVG